METCIYIAQGVHSCNVGFSYSFTSGEIAWDNKLPIRLLNGCIWSAIKTGATNKRAINASRRFKTDNPVNRDAIPCRKTSCYKYLSAVRNANAVNNGPAARAAGNFKGSIKATIGI